jgi:hypothetical protein
MVPHIPYSTIPYGTIWWMMVSKAWFVAENKLDIVYYLLFGYVRHIIRYGMVSLIEVLHTYT